ncbi:MAG: hypothetical protein ACI37T_08200 [Candidatus Gastranaerophilaceae bacterium]
MTEKNIKELIQEQFHKDNFIIRTNSVLSQKNENNTNDVKDEKWAVIYCSSNGVYREDTVDCFKKTILENDNYEWYMNRIPYAEKHIFIRDVSKRFYQFGINDNGLDSIEKVAEKLQQETEGYKIITIGSSSGGMAAIVLGKILKAEFTIAFSPLLRPYKPDEAKKIVEQKIATKEYFDAVEYANSDIPIFYIYPNGSEWDIYNSSLVSDFQNVYFLPIKSDVHGVPINKRVLRKILESKMEKLKSIIKYKTNEDISEYKFALKNWGFGFYLFRVYDFIKKYPLFFLKKDFYTLVLH